VDAIVGSGVALRHWMLSLLTSSKEHRNRETGFHKLDYVGPAFSCTVRLVAKTLWGNVMRVREACSALAPRLQRKLCVRSGIPGWVGFVAPRPDLGVEQWGPGWAPFFCSGIPMQ
jgi:hypothetical protein